MATLFKALQKPWLSTHAILVLKAFPLEYEGYCSREGKDGVDYDVAFRRRQKALFRVFDQEGFEPFPGASGQVGWMLRVADRPQGIVTPPRTQWLKQVMC